MDKAALCYVMLGHFCLDVSLGCVFYHELKGSCFGFSHVLAVILWQSTWLRSFGFRVAMTWVGPRICSPCSVPRHKLSANKLRTDGSPDALRVRYLIFIDIPCRHVGDTCYCPALFISYRYGCMPFLELVLHHVASCHRADVWNKVFCCMISKHINVAHRKKHVRLYVHTRWPHKDKRDYTHTYTDACTCEDVKREDMNKKA